jgi:hypothetical protein
VISDRPLKSEDSADELLQSRTKDCDDAIAWPIMFLYRHAAELFLKTIVVSGDTALTRLSEPLTGLTEMKADNVWMKGRPTHSLNKLTTGADHVFQYLQLDAVWPKGDPDWPSAMKTIRELDELDPTSFMFRYPVDNDGCATRDQGIIFDIVHFASCVHLVFEGLSELAFRLTDHVSRTDL